ncbi:hypothetical protein JCM21738_2584 [Mesobacillus boroniphilus JCM 21738]|uniref:Uncharacterized protein n=1 Tax=Mesobacillus boroniphilus JCM 21738 TaxID=1294265 RepID=W4RQ51_9BACI|nr:hypothetical protein JCM21738_2584 [Mesobacillus boroniphilus JCM 21738]
MGQSHQFRAGQKAPNNGIYIEIGETGSNVNNPQKIKLKSGDRFPETPTTTATGLTCQSLNKLPGATRIKAFSGMKFILSFLKPSNADGFTNWEFLL